MAGNILPLRGTVYGDLHGRCPVISCSVWHACSRTAVPALSVKVGVDGQDRTGAEVDRLPDGLIRRAGSFWPIRLQPKARRAWWWSICHGIRTAIRHLTGVWEAAGPRLAGWTILGGGGCCRCWWLF